MPSRFIRKAMPSPLAPHLRHMKAPPCGRSGQTMNPSFIAPPHRGQGPAHSFGPFAFMAGVRKFRILFIGQPITRRYKRYTSKEVCTVCTGTVVGLGAVQVLPLYRQCTGMYRYRFAFGSANNAIFVIYYR